MNTTDNTTSKETYDSAKNNAQPCIEGSPTFRETPQREPITVTFLLAPPRCGSYALSVLMNTDYCFAHHEGEDFFLLLDQHEDAGFEISYAHACILDCISKGKNYFCCDQSMGGILLIKALKHEGFMRWVKEGLVRLRIFYMGRSLIDSTFSLVSKSRRCGINNRPLSVHEKVRDYMELHIDIITNRLCDKEGKPNIPLDLFAVEDVDLVLQGKGAGDTRLFSVKFLEEVAAFVGAASKKAATKAVGGEWDTEEWLDSANYSPTVLRQIVMKGTNQNFDRPDDEFKAMYDRCTEYFKQNEEGEASRRKDRIALKDLLDLFGVM